MNKIYLDNTYCHPGHVETSIATESQYHNYHLVTVRIVSTIIKRTIVDNLIYTCWTTANNNIIYIDVSFCRELHSCRSNEQLHWLLFHFPPLT